MRFSTTSNKILIFMTGVVAIAGLILFFPINFSGEHTCLLDYIVHAAAGTDVPHSHPSQLLRQYIIPYGLLWWLSIFGVAVVAVALHRMAKSRNISTGQ